MQNLEQRISQLKENLEKKGIVLDPRAVTDLEETLHRWDNGECILFYQAEWDEGKWWVENCWQDSPEEAVRALCKELDADDIEWKVLDHKGNLSGSGNIGIESDW